MNHHTVVSKALLMIAIGNTTFVNGQGVIDNSKSHHVKLRSIPMQDTKLTTGFWADRFELCAGKMLPAMENSMLGDGAAQLNRIKYMAGLTDKHPGGTPWGDGDCYKWIETMAHVYNLNKDPELDKKMDEWIQIIGKAQEPDGYISTNIGHDNEKRFIKVNAHECYNMGHLLTAACIHYRVTGKESFLELAKKTADFLYRQWKSYPKKMINFPWNPSVYMGLIELYRTTRNANYLELTQIMINNRGANPKPGGDHSDGGTDQTQDFVPIREETQAVGHAVTGTYLYCGAADLYAETGEKELLNALERIWRDIFEKKADITCGVAMGIGVSPRPDGGALHEAFSSYPYKQPNQYNETCANIGAGMFNYRMLLLTGDAKYADWTERMIYNTLNSGVDLQGENWFYCNPLSWDGKPGKMEERNYGLPEMLVPSHHCGVRWRVNNCYCCPPSLARTTAQLHNWFYNISDDGALWINFYGGSKLSTTLADGSKIVLSQTTDYPWDGKIKITIHAAGSNPIPVLIRIPGWVENPNLEINGETFTGTIEPGMYVKINRKWKAGDVIELNLPMPVRLIEANPKVEDLHNKVAVMRGPIVFCLELPKQEGGEKVWNDGVFLTENIELKPEHRSDFLNGVTVLKGNMLTTKGRDKFIRDNADMPATATDTADNRLYRPLTPRDLQPAKEGTVETSLIPYYAWANRGLAYMDVWIRLAR